MEMSASSLRYEPRPDQNVALRARIVALAQRHRRYGSPMIYLKLRLAGEIGLLSAATNRFDLKSMGYMSYQ